MSNVEIKLGPAGSHNDQVILNGEDISKLIRAITLKADWRGFPQLVLELAVFDATAVEAENVAVYMEPDTANLLKRAGWTPPTRTEVRGENAPELFVPEPVAVER